MAPDPDERRRVLFHEIVVQERHPRELAAAEGVNVADIFEELDELGLTIPRELMPVDPITQLPTMRFKRLDPRRHTRDWLTPKAAAALLRVTTKGLRRIAEREGIAVRWTSGHYGEGKRPHGGERRYRAEDVRRVAIAREREGRASTGWWLRDPTNQAALQRRRQETGRWN